MKTLEFASYELSRYLAEMGVKADIALNVDASIFDGDKFEQYNPELDDAFSICVKGGKGTIIATNHRAVLMGVYHFLKLQGCRFMMPGKNGEYVPIIESVKDAEEIWYAYTRHRGTTDAMLRCGGIDCMLEFVDWLPKIMMNTYFIELTDGYWDMWYEQLHEGDPYQKPDSLSKEQYEMWHGWLVGEIKKRGLLYHTAGHGFTNMLMEGITEAKRGVVIQKTEDKTPCQNPEILPLINGKRELSNNTPLNTNLCFSKPEVRKLYAEKIYEYSEKHPEVDYLHVWLGDAFANFCECEDCRKMTPTDWYIKVINEVDEEFTRHGSNQKIVFLGYFELLYPPVSEKVKNEDRFTFLFCPYARDFSKRYRDWEVQEVTPIPLNSYKESHMNMGLYLGQYKRWREWFGGDCAVFDYNLDSAIAKVDITHLSQAPILSDDCLYMKEIGLNGRIECANNRYIFPIPMVWYAMSEALFYGSEYSEKECYNDFFGVGEPISEYLKLMQKVLPLDYIERKRNKLTEGEVSALMEALKETEAFRKVLYNYSPATAFHRRNVQMFKGFIDIAEALIDLLIKIDCGITKDGADCLTEQLQKLIYRKEAEMPLYFHGASWLNSFASLIRAHVAE